MEKRNRQIMKWEHMFDSRRQTTNVKYEWNSMNEWMERTKRRKYEIRNKKTDILWKGLLMQATAKTQQKTDFHPTSGCFELFWSWTISWERTKTSEREKRKKLNDGKEYETRAHLQMRFNKIPTLCHSQIDFHLSLLQFGSYSSFWYSK